MPQPDPHLHFDCHMHTPLCGHAIGQPVEYVDTAVRRGISLITITCHIPLSGSTYSQEGIRMSLDDMPRYRDFVAEARAHGEKHGVEVLYGIEAEITPEKSTLDEMQAFIDGEQFDFVLGSLHHMMPFWRHLMAANNVVTDSDKIRFYFEQVALGAETGLYHSIAHPDVIRIYSTLDGRFDPAEHETVIKSCLDRVAASRTCLEINTSGLIKGDFVVHPDPLIMKWALERNIPFTIGSDSHTPDRVGDRFSEVKEEAQAIGLRQLHYFRAGKMISVDL